jgi:shikimate kinase
MTAARTIALIGLRASGKSSVGRALASRLGRGFVDLDDEIVRAASPHGSIGAAFVALGEAAFRDLEARTLERVLAQNEAIVLATGGGVVERAANRMLLEHRALVVWLQVDVPELQRRLRADPTPRPPLLGSDAVKEVPLIAARREPFYGLVAHLEIEAGAGSAAEVAERISTSLASAGLRPGP